MNVLRFKNSKTPRSRVTRDHRGRDVYYVNESTVSVHKFVGTAEGLMIDEHGNRIDRTRAGRVAHLEDSGHPVVVIP